MLKLSQHSCKCISSILEHFLYMYSQDSYYLFFMKRFILPSPLSIKYSNIIFMKISFSVLLSIAALVLDISAVSHDSVSSHHLTVNAVHQFGSSSGGSGFAEFILGPIVFFCSFVCIWYNQKRAAIDSRRLKLAQQICEDVDVTNQQSATSKNGKLVYGNGITRTNAIIEDPLSGISRPNLIKIRRQVQVLQWREKTRKQNNHTITYYELDWVSQNLSNAGTRYNNPGNWFINSDTIYNQNVFLGGYLITKEVADLCNKVDHFNPTIDLAQNILTRTSRRDRQPSLAGEYIYFTPAGQGNFQGGYNPIGSVQGEGTLRVRFLLTPTGPLSIIGQSNSNGPKASFQGFNIARYQGTESQTNNIPDCCCCCISACYAQLLKPIQVLLQVYQQQLTKEQIFQKAVQKSECFTKVMRILSFICMVMGIVLFFSPITTILGYIPLVGGIISGIVGFAIFLAAVLISIPLYLLMISIAWLIFHPKVGIALILIAGAITALVLILGARHGNNSQDSAQTQAHLGLMLRSSIS